MNKELDTPVEIFVLSFFPFPQKLFENTPEQHGEKQGGVCLARGQLGSARAQSLHAALPLSSGGHLSLCVCVAASWPPFIRTRVISD